MACPPPIEGAQAVGDARHLGSCASFERMSSLCELCRAALPQLKVAPLDQKALHDKLYFDREELLLKKMLARLEIEAVDAKSKLVFSGHVGSGKSSELFNLKRLLEEQIRATIVFFSVSRHVNLVGLDGTRVLEGTARALDATLRDKQPGRDPEALEAKIQAAREKVKRVRQSRQSASATAAGAIGAGPVKADARLDTERSTSEEHVYESVADPSGMLALVNALIDEIRRSRRDETPVVLFVDDLEKLDLATARRVFSEGLAFSQVDACMVLTVPIALLYSEHRSGLLGHLDDSPTVLPIVKVRRRDGTVDDANVESMRQMILRRLPDLDQVIAPDAFRRLAISSGGVLRDLVRMMGDLCLDAAALDREHRYELGDVASFEARIRSDFLHQVPPELWPRMARVRQDPSGWGAGVDDELARLLNIAAVLEYANDDTWFRVHPLADHLLGTSGAGS